MNKSRLYKVGALCLTFLGAGTFMAFDDAQTDEQKVETAYQMLVTDFNMEQDSICKTQALAVAQAEYDQMSASAESTEGGNAPAASTGGSSQATQGGNSTPPPPPKEDPKPDAQKGRTGGTASGDADTQKGRTGGTTTSGDTKKNAEDQKRRGGK